MKHMPNIKYDCRWSNQVDETFIEDFCFVENEVFKNDYNTLLFKKKYIDNIYGNSVLSVVYIDGAPSAARALWRNDIEGREAYQPGDTCVLDICRGKGIFSEMTRLTVSMLKPEAIIYNFPNSNSFPGYIKMGWRLVCEYHLVLLLSNKNYKKEHVLDLDETYANWWLSGNPQIRYIKRGNAYYIVRKYPRPYCYKVISKVNEDIAFKFKKIKGLALIFYSSQRKTWYNRHFASLRVVSKMQDNLYIPVWKIDAI